MKTFARLPAGFLGAIALILVSSVLVVALQIYQASARAAAITSSRDAVSRTFNVTTEILSLQNSLQDAERGQRGYLLTGRQDYLAPYRASLDDIPVQVARLKELTRDNPEQQRRWPLLEAQIGIKLDELKRTIDANDREGVEAARKIVATDVGLNAMNAIDGLIGAALNTEAGLLSELSARNIEQGRNVTRLALVTTIFGLAGALAGIFFAIVSARHILQTHVALDQTKAQLAEAQKLEAMGQLTGGIAHDFNNLIHGISWGLKVLQRRLPPLGEDAKAWIEVIKRNADGAASLTQRLLAFSRRLPLKPRPLDFNDVIDGISEFLHQSLGDDISLETVRGGALWFAEVDAGELETAVLNLALNARDAMPDGGKLTLETSNVFFDEKYSAREGIKPGQYVMISVSDTGLGMSKETAAKAFEPFFTTKAAGTATGLGLSQVYGFVKQSSGHVTIHTELGSGTTIMMYFPRLIAPNLRTQSRKIQMPSRTTSAAVLTFEEMQIADETRAAP